MASKSNLKRPLAKGTAARRLCADDWVQAAIARMARHGISGLQISLLAHDLRATKGSFYWHFRDRAALLDAVLERWRQRTIDLNHLLETEEPDPARRMWRLLHLPQEREDTPDAVEFELAIRNWARHSSRARVTEQEVDQMREQLYLRMFSQLGASGRQKVALARVCLAVARQMWGWSDLNSGERQELIETTQALLLQAIKQPLHLDHTMEYGSK